VYNTTREKNCLYLTQLRQKMTEAKIKTIFTRNSENDPIVDLVTYLVRKSLFKYTDWSEFVMPFCLKFSC